MTLYRQPVPSPEERAAQLAAAHRTFVRQQRRRWLARAAGMCIALGVGLVLMGWGLHTTDAGWGAIAFWSGLLVGNGGILLVMLVSFLRAIETGDA